MTVGFDFDKTLTYKDTLLGFFLACARGPKLVKTAKLGVYVAGMVATKAGAMSNDGLKRLGISLFLKGLTRAQVAEAGARYAAGIRLNEIHTTCFAPAPGAVLISAGFEEYLRPLFPANPVVASRLRYDASDGVSGLAFNCYGAAKVGALRAAGYEGFDVFYSDSYSDKPVMDISKTVYLVKGDVCSLIKKEEDL